MSSPMQHDPERTTAIGMSRYASEFMEVAIVADEHIGRREGYEIIPPTPIFFLVAQALELSLKSFLLHKNVPLQKIVKCYRHDLKKLMKKAKEMGLQSIIKISPADEAVLDILNHLYESKQLQYIVTGSKIYPSFGILQKFVLTLVIEVGAEVGYPIRNLSKPF